MHNIVEPMKAHRNSIPKLKFYDAQHIFHHEYFSSRHNSTAAIMTTSRTGSVTCLAGLASVAVSRRPDIIKVCSNTIFSSPFFHRFSLFFFFFFSSVVVCHCCRCCGCSVFLNQYKHSSLQMLDWIDLRS